MTSILDFQLKLTNRLLIWSGLSIVSGIILVLLTDPFWKGFGIQAIIWGLIDAFIAIIGRYNTRKKYSSVTSSDQSAKEASKLRRILFINTVLDVLYISFGVTLTFVSDNPFWRGNGFGIIIQGIFLFLFDLTHKLRIKE
ncbi:TPA: hypothetical protein ENX78_00725 [Candidatus Poribacteria bacterium]|nr:hypothetical protein [Candidatus Poribacteria bacterium]